MLSALLVEWLAAPINRSSRDRQAIKATSPTLDTIIRWMVDVPRFIYSTVCNEVGQISGACKMVHILHVYSHHL